MLRIGIIGAAHWHFPNYVNPLLAYPGVRIVAVSDPEPDVARRRGESLGCEWSADFREICRRDKVDFVFGLGRHCDMAAQGVHLIENDIPFAMEKPCGLNSAEVSDLAGRAARHGSFAAVPFVWRQTDFANVLSESVAGDRFEYLSLRIVSGHPDRYIQSGNAWMLDPALAGGGSTINLAVHLFDLFRMLTGADDVEVTAASMSNAAFGLPIEDWSTVIVRAGAARCVAETGFLYPAPTGVYDIRFTIKTDNHYVLTGPESTEVLDIAGGRLSAATAPANEPTYATFVIDVLDRFRRGARPLAGLSDMAAVMTDVDRAYKLALPLDAPGRPKGAHWYPPPG